MPSISTTRHCGTCGRNSAISASVTVGSPLRQATQTICSSCSIFSYLPFIATKNLPEDTLPYLVSLKYTIMNIEHCQVSWGYPTATLTTIPCYEYYLEENNE